MNSRIRAALAIGGGLMLSLTAPITASATNSVSTLQNITPGIDNKNIHGSSVNPYGLASSITADGSIIAYATYANNMVPNDTDSNSDVFLYHTRTKQTERIKPGDDPNRTNVDADISPNGRYVAIHSYELVKQSDGSTTLVSDLFVHDRTLDQNTQVNIDAAGKRIDVQSIGSMSNNGRVAFTSRTLYTSRGSQFDILVADILAGTLRRASDTHLPGQYFYSREPQISADGRYVAFTSNRPHQDAPGQNVDRIYLSDLHTNKITLVSQSEHGAIVNSPTTDPSLSDNGKHIAFVTSARLMSQDTDNFTDVYQRNLETGQLTFISQTMKNVPVPQEGASDRPSVSADGKYTTFASHGAIVRGNTKIPRDFYEQPDVFIHLRDYGITRIISHTVPLQDDSTREVLYGNSMPTISGDGKSIVFATKAQEIYPEHATAQNLHLYHNPVVHIPYYDPGDIIELL